MSESIKLTFLGTGTSQGVPMIGCRCDVCQSTDERDKRLRASVLIETEGLRVVVDCGPDFRQQMLRAKVYHLDAILLTHEHKDHIAGLDDVRAYNYFQQQPFDVFAEERVQKALVREFSYAFSEVKYPGVPEINMHTISHHHPFKVGKVNVTPLRVMHLNLPVLGFRIGNMAYITDANAIPEETMPLLNGLRVLVINALRPDRHISHFSLSEALELIDQLKPERAYITHMSHQIGDYKTLETQLPANVYASYDGLEVFC